MLSWKSRENQIILVRNFKFWIFLVEQVLKEKASCNIDWTTGWNDTQGPWKMNVSGLQYSVNFLNFVLIAIKILVF